MPDSAEYFLDAKIKRDDMMACGFLAKALRPMPTALCPGIIFRAGDTACKVGPLKARKILQLGRQCRLIKLAVWRMSQHGIEHAVVANAGCDGARINPANDR